ncbi:DNA polymerase III subunit gamma/tau, partial [Methylobacterium sp. WL30]
ARPLPEARPLPPPRPVLVPAPVAPAPVVQGRPAEPAGPRLSRFEDVVALADVRRDILLKSALEREAHLVRFEDGRIEFRQADGGRPSLHADLAKALEQWTGRRWIVTPSREAGAPTLDAQARAAIESRRENAASHPLVREVLARFPGAQIVDVRDNAPEAASADLEAPAGLDEAATEDGEADDA